MVFSGKERCDIMFFMETFISGLKVFGKSVPLGTVVILGFLVYQSQLIRYQGQQIKQINHKLDNHITETNKKIDRLSDRFDRLYEVLIKDKK